jgi:cytochrome c peroxidase
VSIGDDGRSRGTRNAPALTYAARTPPLARAADGAFRGGFFHDGRAATLAVQAVEPIFNPLEMALADTPTLRARLGENAAYPASITALFGAAAMADDASLLAAVGESLAAFERTAEFAPYDSRYDRFLRGELALSRDEERGRALFFSSVVNCSNCHRLPEAETETFTDFTYHNIGVPGNPALAIDADVGLGGNPLAGTADEGKFRVPSLRNVAVTAPYMHNGVFSSLRTTLVFYNTYLLHTPLNPETGEPWGPPEVGRNISHDLLRAGQPLSSVQIDALLAFLRALTDQRYEGLLK